MFAFSGAVAVRFPLPGVNERGTSRCSMFTEWGVTSRTSATLPIELAAGAC